MVCPYSCMLRITRIKVNDWVQPYKIGNTPINFRETTVQAQWGCLVKLHQWLPDTAMFSLTWRMCWTEEAIYQWFCFSEQWWWYDMSSREHQYVYQIDWEIFYMQSRHIVIKLLRKTLINLCPSCCTHITFPNPALNWEKVKKKRKKKKEKKKKLPTEMCSAGSRILNVLAGFWVAGVNSVIVISILVRGML